MSIRTVFVTAAVAATATLSGCASVDRALMDLGGAARAYHQQQAASPGQPGRPHPDMMAYQRGRAAAIRDRRYYQRRLPSRYGY